MKVHTSGMVLVGRGKTPFWIMITVVPWLLIVSSHRAWCADYWQEAMANAKAKVDTFVETTVKPGSGASDATKIKTLIELKGDPIATSIINDGDLYPDSTRQAANDLWDPIVNKTEQNIKNRAPQQLGGKPKEYSTFNATNQRPPQVRVPNDLDVTVTRGNNPVPHQQSKGIVENAVYDAVNDAAGKNVFGNKTPSEAAEGLRVEVTDSTHAEAYGGSPREGKKILSSDKSQPLADPEQLSKAIEYKSTKPAVDAADATNAAKKAAAKGDKAKAKEYYIKAEKSKYDQAYQAVKQYDKQVKPAVEARGGNIPNQVEKGMEILRDVKDGKISLDKARTKLAKMGETPESISSKSGNLVEAAHKLQPGGLRGKRSPNPGEENAIRKWNFKKDTGQTGQGYSMKTDPDTVKAVEKTKANQQKWAEKIKAGKAGGRPGPKVPSGWVIGDGSFTVTKGGSFTVTSTKGKATGVKVLGAGGVILAGLQVYDIGKEYMETGDAYKAAKDVAMLGGMTVAGGTIMGGVAKVSPTAAIAIGTYLVSKGLTEEILNRTETGQAINEYMTDSFSETAEEYDSLTGMVLGLGDPLNTHEMNAQANNQQILISMVKSGEFQVKDGMSMADAIQKYQETGTLKDVVEKKPSPKPPQIDPEKKARIDYENKQAAYEAAYLDAVEKGLISSEEKEKFQHGYNPKTGKYEPEKAEQYIKSMESGQDGGVRDKGEKGEKDVAEVPAKPDAVKTVGEKAPEETVTTGDKDIAEKDDTGKDGKILHEEFEYDDGTKGSVTITAGKKPPEPPSKKGSGADDIPGNGYHEAGTYFYKDKDGFWQTMPSDEYNNKKGTGGDLKDSKGDDIPDDGSHLGGRYYYTDENGKTQSISEDEYFEHTTAKGGAVKRPEPSKSDTDFSARQEDPKTINLALLGDLVEKIKKDETPPDTSGGGSGSGTGVSRGKHGFKIDIDKKLNEMNKKTKEKIDKLKEQKDKEQNDKDSDDTGSDTATGVSGTGAGTGAGGGTPTGTGTGDGGKPKKDGDSPPKAKKPDKPKSPEKSVPPKSDPKFSRAYYPNGNLSYEVPIIYSKRIGTMAYHGVFKKWTESGQLIGRIEYEDGREHGLYQKWYDNGQPWGEGSYKNDVQDGVWKEWDSNGNLIEINKYSAKCGKPRNPCRVYRKTYYKSGQIKSEQVFGEDEHHFQWRETGKMFRKEFSKNGKLVKKCFLRGGNLGWKCTTP